MLAKLQHAKVKKEMHKIMSSVTHFRKYYLITIITNFTWKIQHKRQIQSKHFLNHIVGVFSFCLFHSLYLSRRVQT